MRSRRGVILALTAGLACGDALPPAGQVALYVDTDAIVADDRTIGLFDTLRVEVLPPNADEPCAGCTRLVDVRAADFEARAVSFGVPLPPGSRGWRARLRLYPRRAAPTGALPQWKTSVVDVTVPLPAVAVTGLVERTAFLPTESVGLEVSAETEPGAPRASRVGTWEGGRATPCAGAPRAGEVCVPGGAFWMGNADALALLGNSLGAAPSTLDATALRLVVLSPFFVDADAMTVSKARASGNIPSVSWWSGNASGDDGRDFCTFTPDPSANDDLPLNCVPFLVAQSLCRGRGAELLTEAQFERVASAGLTRRFVWGEDPPSCSDAVFGRAGWGVFKDLDSPCKGERPGGPLVVGSRASPRRRDRLELAGGAVYDVVGNMGTWTADLWQRQTEPCWSAGGVFRDPVCDEASMDGLHRTRRGGGWSSSGGLPAAYRAWVDAPTVDLGVRCARSALTE